MGGCLLCEDNAPFGCIINPWVKQITCFIPLPFLYSKSLKMTSNCGSYLFVFSVALLGIKTKGLHTLHKSATTALLWWEESIMVSILVPSNFRKIVFDHVGCKFFNIPSFSSCFCFHPNVRIKNDNNNKNPK